MMRLLSILSGLLIMLLSGCSKDGKQLGVVDVAVDADTVNCYVLADIAKGKEDAFGNVYAPETMKRALYRVVLRTGVFSKVKEFNTPCLFASEGGKACIILQFSNGQKRILKSDRQTYFDLPAGIKYCRMSAYDPNMFTYLIDSTVYGVNLSTFVTVPLMHFDSTVSYYKWSGEVFEAPPWNLSTYRYGYSSTNSIASCNSDVLKFGFSAQKKSSYRCMHVYVGSEDSIQITAQGASLVNYAIQPE